MSGRVVHFEIPFDDGDRARSFYADVFDWRMQPMPDFDYTGVLTGPVSDDGTSTEPGYVNGGLAGRGDIPGGGTVVTIDVEDIDATFARVEAHGGAVVQERQPVGDMGFTAYVRDSEGNVVGLWQNAG